MNFFAKLIPLLALVSSAQFVCCAETLPARSGPSTHDACSPLAQPAGRVVRVGNVSQLQQALLAARPDTTIALLDGTYLMDGLCLVINVAHLSIRSDSGNKDAVILDGEYKSSEIIQINASNVTIANLTLRRATDHLIHVMPSMASDTSHVLIYNVHGADSGEQAVKINPTNDRFRTDDGEIACSHLELTDAGRSQVRDNCYTGGIDAHRSSGWVVRDNLIEGFWCRSGISEHAVHFWGNSGGTVVERNVLANNARGVGFGMTDGGNADPVQKRCPDAPGYVDHFGGIIRNNFIFANSKEMFDSESGFDNGISLWQACRPKVMHNTVYSANPSRTYSSIEWRFPLTHAEIVNNLVNVKMLEREGARALKSGNTDNADATWFLDAGKGDLHLSPAGRRQMKRVQATADVPGDIDGDACAASGLCYPGADKPTGK
jgi:hypothetical protein